jgi:hypothetical protein
VGGADQVERRAHRGRADDAAVVQRVVELFPAEAVEPGPQREERRLRLLRLEAAEAVDCCCDVFCVALQQQLAGERRAVEGPEGELVLHGVDGRACADEPAQTDPLPQCQPFRNARSYSTRTYCRARAPGTRTVTRYSPGRRGRKNRR